MNMFNAAETAQLLPYPELAETIRELLLSRHDGLINIPERLFVDLPGNGKLLVMPAADADLAITKLVTVHPDNPAQQLPTIQGEVLVMRASNGERLALLEGATVTGHRTAALSLLAVLTLAPVKAGPLLVFGAGVQARSHIEAFHAGLGLRDVFIVSRTRTNAEELAAHARSLGMNAEVIEEPAAVLDKVKLIVMATTSRTPLLDAALAADIMICAVGAFKADMAELSPRVINSASRIVVDMIEGARAEAGDLIQAAAQTGWNWTRVQQLEETFLDAGNGTGAGAGPVIFKSVGHALFDLAAARLALLG
jgi:ornithine cyclodeaminase